VHSRYNDVTECTQSIAKIIGVIFLDTTTKQLNQFAIEINLFESREEVIPVTLRFAIIPGWDAQQQNVISFQIFFAAFCNVMDIGNVFTKLFLKDRKSVV